MRRGYLSLTLIFLLVVAFLSCGGGGGGGGGGSTVPSTPPPTAGITDANGQVTLSVSGTSVTFQVRDVDGKPATGAAVGINMDTGTKGVGVMLISDPTDRFPPKIRIVIGTGGPSTSSTQSSRASATQGANVPVPLFGKNDVGPIVGATDDAIGYLEIAGITAPAIQIALTGVQLVTPLISLASTIDSLLGGQIGTALVNLGRATKVTVTTDEFTSDLRAANTQNGIKFFVMTGLTLSTFNPLTAEQAGGVVLDAGLNYYNSQIYGGCRSGTVDKVVSYGFTLGYACGTTTTVPSLYGSLFDAKTNGQPVASGLFQMVSKDEIGLAITGVLDSNGSTTVKLPVGNYDVTVVPPSGSSGTSATSKTSVTVNADGSPISISNFTLSVVKAGTGGGTIASSPSGTTFTSGTAVTLTATPNSDSTFTGWSGACSGTGYCVVTMDTAKTVTATFTLTSPTQKPNLTPYQPAGWSDKIVVSNGTGTPLLSTDTLFVGWAVVNNGLVSPSIEFDVQLSVDGVPTDIWPVSPPLPHPNYYVSISNFSIGSLSAGTHTIKILADSAATVDEVNESDNDYTKTITVTDPPPGEVTGIAFSGGVGGWGSFVNVKITPDGLYGVPITCDWVGDLGSKATRTTTTLHSDATCSNADVASWPDSTGTITATVTGTPLSVSINY